MAKNVEELLSQLHTEEGVANAVISLTANSEVFIPDKYIDMALDFCKKSDRFWWGINIAKRTGRSKQEREFYVRQIEYNLQNGHLTGALDCAKEAKLIPTSKQYTNYNWHWEYVAEIADKAGLTDKMIAFYEKKGKYASAGELAVRTGSPYRAIEFFEKAFDFKRAAEIAYEAKMHEKAIELYEKGGYFAKAASVAEKAGKTALAQAYQTIDDLASAPKKAKAR